MDVLSIVLIIVGIVVVFFSSLIFASSSTALNKKNWPSFVEKAKEKDLPVSEDELFRLVNKINSNACIALIIGLVIVLLGVMLRLFM